MPIEKERLFHDNLSFGVIYGCFSVWLKSALAPEAHSVNLICGKTGQKAVLTRDKLNIRAAAQGTGDCIL